MNFNIELFFQIHNLAYKNSILDFLMVFGAIYLIFIVYLLIIIFFLKGALLEKKAALLTFLGLVVSFFIVQFIRLFIFEPRPFVTFPIKPLVEELSTHSFPSIHTTLTAVAAFAFIYYKSKLAPFFIFSLLWIGFARIFVGVHYPLDISGGILVSFLSVFLATKLIKKFPKS